MKCQAFFVSKFEKVVHCKFFMTFKDKNGGHVLRYSFRLNKIGKKGF